MDKVLRLLIIESSSSEAEVLTNYLASAGYSLRSERIDRKDAMAETLGSATWDLILINASMPDFTCASAIEILRSSGQDIPLIAISSDQNQDIALETMLCGAHDFLVKDDLSRLVPAIERELNEATNRQLQRRSELERSIVHRIIQGAVTTTKLDDFLKLVYHEINDRVAAENCFIALHDPSDNTLHFDYWEDKVDPCPPPRPIDRSFTSYVLRTGEPLLVTKETEQRMYESGDAELVGSSSPSWLGVPLKTSLRTVGVMVIQDYDREDLYDERDLEFMTAVGDQVAMAIERKRSDDALIRSEEQYRLLVENALDIIYTHDLNGNYTSVNRAAETITGFTREETLSMNMTSVIAPEFVEVSKEMIAAKLRGEENTAYQIDVIVKHGVRKSLEVNTRIIYENGNPVGIQGIARDITERKQLEDKLRQSQKLEAIGLLAGGVAHDFNNLLTVISGYSDLALMKISEDNDLRQNIEEIRNAAERASELTSQLLAFGRKQVLKPKVHNVNSIILNLKKMLKRVIRENIVLQTDLDPRLGNVRADAGQIEQVIMNLAVNARDAMLHGGILTISTKNSTTSDEASIHESIVPDRQCVTIEVQDTGVGIDQNTQSRIFEPFFTTKESGKGSGLGLSTVHGIVKQSGGSISVRSEPGRGTTFVICLPTVEDEVESSRWGQTKVDAVTGNETILLVEDDNNVRQLALELLIGKGYNVLEASSGPIALDICQSYPEKIDLLLTDVIMPEMSGPELAKQIEKLRPTTKRLFMSGYADDSISLQRMFDIKHSFIEKPFSTDNLASKIREALDH